MSRILSFLPVRRPLCLFALIFALILALLLNFSEISSTDYTDRKGDYVDITGTVLAKEYKRQEDGSLILRVTLKTSDTKALLSLPVTDDDLLPIGADAHICGNLYPIQEPSNPGEFDLKTYYRTLGISYRITNGKLIAVSDFSRDPLGNILYQVKRFLSNRIDDFVSTEDAMIIKAMLLGEKGFLDSDTKDLYRETGIIHVLAISGLHISILAMGLLKLLRKFSLPFGPSATVAAVFILLYGKMTGYGTSTFRAVTMFLLYLISKLIGRTYDLLSAVCLCALLLLLEQPYYLMSSGFQFSFGCVLGIGILSPSLEKTPLEKLSIPLFTLPIHLWNNFTFTVYSIPINLAVIPLMSGVMVLSLAMLILGLFLAPAGNTLGFLIHNILYFYRALCILSEGLPFAQLSFGKPLLWEVVLYYIVVFAIVFIRENPGLTKNMKPLFSNTIRKVTKRKIIVRKISEQIRETDIFTMGAFILAILLLLFRPAPLLSMDFLDVGQGDGIVISCGRGSHILIDGGSTSKSDLTKYQLEPFLSCKGISSLDLAILTHADEDHCSGLIALMEDDFPIERIFLPKIPSALQNDNYAKILELSHQKNIPVGYLSQGDVLQISTSHTVRNFLSEYMPIDVSLEPESVTLTCLNPAAQSYSNLSASSLYSSANAASLVLYLQCGDFTALLTGDVEDEGERELLSFLNNHPEYPDHITLLKVAHHGSGGATTSEFLEKLDFDIGIISCGRDNVYGHPHKELIDRLSEDGLGIDLGNLYITSMSGAVHVQTDGAFARISTFFGK